MRDGVSDSVQGIDMRTGTYTHMAEKSARYLSVDGLQPHRGGVQARIGPVCQLLLEPDGPLGGPPVLEDLAVCAGGMPGEAH